jgi:hypothetical protein
VCHQGAVARSFCRGRTRTEDDAGLEERERQRKRASTNDEIEDKGEARHEPKRRARVGDTAHRARVGTEAIPASRPASTDLECSIRIPSYRSITEIRRVPMARDALAHMSTIVIARDSNDLHTYHLVTGNSIDGAPSQHMEAS